ncbi:MAG: DUF4255 domain-containing protein [Desulfobulbaceae bacterium]|nr:DUF4255 domain-containing protein [Desulfobulbaceae bacterium]
MINALDETLKALLRRDLPSELAKQVQISFATPDDQFPPQSVTLPAIDLFLYDVRENNELRSNEISIERGSDGSVTKKRPPIRVDFSYLVTAWPSESVPEPAQDEHRLLGEVMRVLLCYRKLPEDVLQGVLKGQHPPLPVSSLQPGRLQSLGEFWQALGGKPKAALNYQITLSVDVAKPKETHLVTEKVIKVRLKKGEKA